MTLINQLNQKHAINKCVKFTQGKGGIPCISVTTQRATATISLLGGQVLSYLPANTEHDLLFVSGNAYFQTGKAIKGGAPICWPWFAAHPEDGSLPFHGLVRNQLWQVDSIQKNANQDVVITLIYKDSEETRDVWPYCFGLKELITIGKTLAIELITTNTGKQPFTITQAIHTYFRVGDIKQVQVIGLENNRYLDKVEQFKEKTQSGPIFVKQEVDRIYQAGNQPLLIDDKDWNRQIHINHSGSNTSVVWNPWIDISRHSKDLQDDDYQRFICVETANAANDIVTVEPNEIYKLSVDYRVNENQSRTTWSESD